MLQILRRPDVLGRAVLDRDGAFVGTVVDTAPLDGGGEVELLLVNLGRRFSRRAYVPAGDVRVAPGAVHLPHRRWAVEDAPSAEDRRWGAPADLARAYWHQAGE